MAAKTVTDRTKKAALDKALRGLFGRLKNRPVSDRLMSLVDELEAADQPPVKKTKSA
jgi:hypothetical protein